MELYLLNSQFKLISAPVDRMVSVVWSMRFFECGSFRIIFPAERDLLTLLKSSLYVCTNAGADGMARCGRIEYTGYYGNNYIEVSGRLLESLLCDRIINSPASFSGTVTSAVCSAVSQNLRGLPVEISAESDIIEDEVTLYGDWDVLSDWVYQNLKPFGASYMVLLDVIHEKAVFKIVRSVNDGYAPVFSSSFENIAEVRYEASSRDMKNTAYVEGNDGVTAVLDLSGGGDVREIYCRAYDIKPSDFETQALYTEALKQRGRAVLAEHPAEEYISCAADTSVKPVYGEDYHIGDMCYVEDELTGISVYTRITELDEVWENGGIRVYPAFGEKISGIKSKLKNN